MRHMDHVYQLGKIETWLELELFQRTLEVPIRHIVLIGCFSLLVG